jgi:hypothetical protein
MSRRNRIALLAALVLLVVVAGTVFATRQPPTADAPAQVTQDEDEAPPSAEDIAHAKSRLEAKGIPFEEAALNDLAARYGIGGAVRVLAWAAADADDEWTVATITEKRDTGGTEGTVMGWGRIAKDLGMHPGIGSIMGNGGGNGRANAPGQQDRGTDEGDASGG